MRSITGERRAVAGMMAEVGTADDELRMLVLAYRDVERDPRAMNVQLENFFGDFDGTVRRVLRFLLFDEADIPAMAEAAKRLTLKVERRNCAITNTSRRRKIANHIDGSSARSRS